SVFRSNQKIYANINSPEDDRVIASASTLEPDVRTELSEKAINANNLAAADIVGKRVAERAKTADIEPVDFDRSSFRYHGRVKWLEHKVDTPPTNATTACVKK